MIRPLALSLLLGCATATEQAEVDLSPWPADGQSCAVCGMIVLEQPAPRGQVVHRDGEHAWFCSLADLRAYVQTPSPLGRPERVWVERMTDADPLSVIDTRAREWVPATDLTYVVGFEREGVMGLPAVGVGSPAEADSLARRLGGRPSTWNQLLATPFNQDPSE